MKKYTQEDVDKWVEESGDYNAFHLFREEMPKMAAKMNRLDKQIQKVLAEVQTVFPDAQYYTASGGFNLILGATHDNSRDCDPQQQRTAWGGSTQIGDGDW